MPLVVWLYNSNSGVVAPFPSAVASVQLSSGLGWHGPFNSKQEAEQYYARLKSEQPTLTWKPPTQDIGTAFGNAGDSAVDATKKALDPLAKYDLNSWLLRIGEILLGLVLLGVGIAKLTGTTNMVAKAVKAAI